jgi:hypothetical protein
LSSDFLFVRPSLFRGFARTLDFVGSLDSYNWSGSGQEADARAMSVDWSLVAADVNEAMKAFVDKPVDRAGNEQLNLIDAAPR